jgi:hypothetical protein
MSEINLLVRTADRSRKADTTVADTQTVGDIIQTAIMTWALPSDKDYSIVCVSKDPPLTLDTTKTLAASGIVEGDTLEIQPVLVAGEF